MTTTRLEMTTDPDALLNAARAGDEDAFRAVVAPHRAELHAHCYRMLASMADADDALQETLVKAWRGLPNYEGRSSLRTWLFRIATNVGIDASTRRARREIPVEFAASGAEPAEASWLGPYPEYIVNAQETSPESRYEARESLEIAFVAGLQYLPAQQRAVLILREVFAFSAQEAADMLGTTVAAVNSALQRARHTLSARRPLRSQQEELAALGDSAVRQLAEAYAQAIEAADIDRLLGLVTSDVSWSMPPVPNCFLGLVAVRRFLTEDVFPNSWRHVITTASGQLAVAGYILDEDAGAYLPVALDLLDLRDGKIASVIGFLTSQSLSPEEREHYGPLGTADFSRFGLPEQLPA